MISRSKTASIVLSTALLCGAKAFAAPIITVTPQGSAIDNAGDTTTGYRAFVLTATADIGQVISSFDLGQNANFSNGIYGNLLQDYVPAAKGGTATPTPVESSQNGGPYGIDSHLLITNYNGVNGGPIENSDLVNPPGAPANDSADAYGTGSYLHGLFTVGTAAQANSVAFAYLVIPGNSQATYTIGVGEGIQNVGGSTYTLSGTVNAVPEPMSLSMLGMAAFGLIRHRFRR